MFSICTLIDSLNAARLVQRELGRKPRVVFAYIWSQLKPLKRLPISFPLVSRAIVRQTPPFPTHPPGISKPKHDNLQMQGKLPISPPAAGELVSEPGHAGEPGASLAASKCQHLLE